MKTRVLWSRAFAGAVLILVSISSAGGAEVQYGIIGDAGLWNSAMKDVQKSMLQAGVSRTILPGDNLYLGTYAQQWNPMISAGFSFDVVAIGNHNGGYDAEMRFFKMPSEYYSKTQSRLDLPPVFVQRECEKRGVLKLLESPQELLRCFVA